MLRPAIFSCASFLSQGCRLPAFGMLHTHVWENVQSRTYRGGTALSSLEQPEEENERSAVVEAIDSRRVARIVALDSIVHAIGTRTGVSCQLS
jgi:hypothetical protein